MTRDGLCLVKVLEVQFGAEIDPETQNVNYATDEQQ